MTSEIKVDTISEQTSANGVAVDGVTLKDGAVGAAGTATSVAGIPFYFGNDNSIYTHDVSGTDNQADQNTAYGITAMDAITTGDDNTAIGNGALSALNTGEQNVAVGRNAMLVATNDNYNTVIGSNAGRAIAGGGNNNTLMELRQDVL